VSILKEHRKNQTDSKKALTPQRVREIIGKSLKWQSIQVRLDLEIFEALKRIAPDGDVKRLIKETIQKLIAQRKTKYDMFKDLISYLNFRIQVRVLKPVNFFSCLA